MKTVGLALIAIWLLVAAVAQGFEEPAGFAGIRFGDSPEAVQGALAAAGCHMMPIDKGDPGEYVAYHVLGCNPASYEYRGPVRWADMELHRLVYRLVHGRMVRVEFAFSAKEYLKLRNAFTERYGPPTSVTAEVVRNSHGTPFDKEQLLWDGKRVQIRLEERGGLDPKHAFRSLRMGEVSLGLPDYTDWLMEKERVKEKARAKSLD